MPAADDHPTIHRHGAVREPRDSDLRYKRYMRRRRIGSADRNGDPLDGLANLFLLAIVLAVGLLVAVLTSAGLSGLLTEKNMTIVTDPGTPQMQVIVKQGGKIEAVDMSATARQQGLGSLVGSFYRLADGTIVYVPADGNPRRARPSCPRRRPRRTPPRTRTLHRRLLPPPARHPPPEPSRPPERWERPPQASRRPPGRPRGPASRAEPGRTAPPGLRQATGPVSA